MACPEPRQGLPVATWLPTPIRGVAGRIPAKNHHLQGEVYLAGRHNMLPERDRDHSNCVPPDI